LAVLLTVAVIAMMNFMEIDASNGFGAWIIDALEVFVAAKSVYKGESFPGQSDAGG